MGVWVYSSSKCNGAPWQFHTVGSPCSFIGWYPDGQLVAACAPQVFNAPKELHEKVMRALFEWVFYNDLLEGVSFTVPLTDDEAGVLSELVSRTREGIKCTPGAQPTHSGT